MRASHFLRVCCSVRQPQPLVLGRQSAVNAGVGRRIYTWNARRLRSIPIRCCCYGQLGQGLATAGHRAVAYRSMLASLYWLGSCNTKSWPLWPHFITIMISLLPGLSPSHCGSVFYFRHILAIFCFYVQSLIIYSSFTTRCGIYTILSNGNKGTEGLISLPWSHSS